MADELKQKILDVLRGNPVMAVSSVDGEWPASRYMMVGTADDLSMTTAAFAGSRKIAQLQANAHVHLLCGFDPKMPNRPYVTVRAMATLHTDAETKNACWVESLSGHFTGPEDENYVVLKFHPVRLEYWTMESYEPEVLDV